MPAQLFGTVEYPVYIFCNLYVFLFCFVVSPHLANATEKKNKSPKRGEVDSCSVLHVESTLNTLINEHTGEGGRQREIFSFIVSMYLCRKQHLWQPIHSKDLTKLTIFPNYRQSCTLCPASYQKIIVTKNMLLNFFINEKKIREDF